MPYAKSVKAIRRVELYLQKMVDSQTNLHFPSDNPTRLNHHIRDGINASFVNKERFADFAKLSTKFIIRVKPTEVFCELRDGKIEQSDLQLTKSLSFPECTSLLHVIGAAIKHHLDELSFPNAVMTEDDVSRLNAWAERNGYSVETNTSKGTILRKINEH